MGTPMEELEKGLKILKGWQPQGLLLLLMPEPWAPPCVLFGLWFSPWELWGIWLVDIVVLPMGLPHFLSVGECQGIEMGVCVCVGGSILIEAGGGKRGW